uniref:3-keto-steroid reductase n=1 Tax=Ciona savignyi TaxID=51511 RepID=H2ZBV5_CIOSA
MGTIPERYVVITGATSGIGLALVNRLASEFNQNHRLHLCLLCRNMSKGSLVKQDIESHHKTVVVDLVKMDVSSVQSVRAASQKIINMYSRIDCMYLNAGIMPVAKFNIPYVMKTMFTSEGLQMFKTGLGMFSANDGTTVDGVKNIFATNVLGHFILVDEVIPVLTSQNDQHCAQIIWTGSTNASKKSFKLNDVTCKNGHVADPGTAKTNINKGFCCKLDMVLCYSIHVSVAVFFTKFNNNPI